MSRPAYEVVLRPVITEKTSSLQSEGTDATVTPDVRSRAEVRPKYTFEVAPDASKVEIRQAVERLFEVKVTRVRTMNCRGKKRRLGKSLGRKPHWKKAIVEVAKGQSIEVFEGA
ncbi:MAG: 50S ribosomal protein L23 [Gemmatimonadota bacterium]